VTVTVRVPIGTRRGGRAHETGIRHTRRQLLELADWLRSWCVRRAVDGSTSYYWNPVFFLLEQQASTARCSTRVQGQGTAGLPQPDKLDSLAWLAKVKARRPI